MSRYSFRILNVFAESTFGGNPLCVFEDASGMSDDTMQALARQFNLSETAFLLPSEVAMSRVRIFTPNSEMPFAGHPTLGSAHVVRQLRQCGDRFALEMRGGIVPVAADGDLWNLTAPGNSTEVATRRSGLAIEQTSALLGLNPEDIAGEPQWIDTGSEQMLISLRSPDAVHRARPSERFSAEWPSNRVGRKNAYVFAHTGLEGDRQTMTARYFFASPSGICEDPGTGSACANLGGWLKLANHALPLSATISQGVALSRPCTLLLDVSHDGEIRVGGRVLELGCGSVDI